VRQVFGLGLAGAIFLASGVLFLGGPFMLPAILVMWLGISVVLAGLAYLIQFVAKDGARLFSKKADGNLHPITLMVFLPFISSRYVNVLLYRLFSREAAATDIDGDLWLGGRIFPWDWRTLKGSQVRAVLDVTAELPGDPGMKGDDYNYLALPVLDGTGPTLDQLILGVEWALGHIEAQRPVLVQCTMGHGRSATFAAGVLLARMRAKTIDQAVEMMSSKRNRVRLNRSQRSSLEQAMKYGLLWPGGEG
jgi:hypothetical protein